MPWLNEVHAKTLRGALYGGVRGGAAGAAASLATGAAIVTTIPAWLPFIGGSAVVALGTVAVWSATGSALGAAVAATRAYFKHNQEERAFEEAFPPQQKTIP
jgi:protein-S-isoprenylcysteine O-methyltransferase Ste14